MKLCTFGADFAPSLKSKLKTCPFLAFLFERLLDEPVKRDLLTPALRAAFFKPDEKAPLEDPDVAAEPMLLVLAEAASA